MVSISTPVASLNALMRMVLPLNRAQIDQHILGLDTVVTSGFAIPISISIYLSGNLHVCPA
jgi:hypothetical protein